MVAGPVVGGIAVRLVQRPMGDKPNVLEPVLSQADEVLIVHDAVAVGRRGDVQRRLISQPGLGEQSEILEIDFGVPVEIG